MPRPKNESVLRLGPFTMIYRDRWHSPGFVELSWDEKAAYSMIETFDGINAAGVIRAEAGILAQKHPDKSAEEIDLYLTSLADKGWISRRGSEIFVRDWFIRNPSYLKSDKNVKSIHTAINRVGYDDLRHDVIQVLYASILEVERVDKSQTPPSVKKICREIAVQYSADLPDKLGGNGGKP